MPWSTWSAQTAKGGFSYSLPFTRTVCPLRPPPKRRPEKKLSMADARLGSCCRDLGDGVQREGRKVKQKRLKMLLLL